MSCNLVGSDEQIARAIAIRAEILSTEASVVAHLDDLQSMIDVGTAPAYFSGRLGRIRARLASLKGETSAAWWIDYRGARLDWLIDML